MTSKTQLKKFQILNQSLLIKNIAVSIQQKFVFSDEVSEWIFYLSMNLGDQIEKVIKCTKN